VLLKGILHAEDARLAVRHGVDGLMLSNHGGRQLDTVPATIDLLPDIVAAVNGRIPVILDGGVRRGTDVVKALALGASAVGIGRPVLWGLAVDGERGVRRVLDLLRDEVDQTLALCGAGSPADLTPDLVRARR
jgi:4-hydroxymandelate oxidase